MKLYSDKPELTFDDVLLLPNKSDYWIDDDVHQTNLSTRISQNLEIDLPITSSPMPGVTEVEMAVALGKMGGLGFLHPFQSHQQQLSQAKEIKQQKVKLAVSISDLSEQGVKQVEALLKIDVDLICVETAHAENKQTLAFIRKIRKKHPQAELGASTVVTKKATRALIKAGINSIRVGIGGGSHCTTRLVAGVGRPQLSAVQECVQEAKKHQVPIISETGIRYAGDIVKAIAFGADGVMIGGLLSGTNECPGEIIKKRGQYYKHSWGMCTMEALNKEKPWKKSLKYRAKALKRKFKDVVLHQPTIEDRGFEEGVAGLIPYKGSVKPVVENLKRGIQRSMWYLGATNLKEIKEKSRIVMVTSNTQQDNLPRI